MASKSRANRKPISPPFSVTGRCLRRCLTMISAALAAGERPDQLAEDHEMAERNAEIGDLTRRVVIGAVLTTPVLFADDCAGAGAVHSHPA